MQKKAVVLLPTFNERDNLEAFISEIFSYAPKAPGWNLEVLVVDGGSSDGTLELARNLGQSNPRIHTYGVGRGLGVALIEGHRHSIATLKPDALLQLDADGQVDAQVVPKLLGVLDEGFDLAIGSRFISGGKNNLSLSRRIFSLGAGFVARNIMGPSDIHEFTNLARAFTPTLFQKLDLSLVPWRETSSFVVQPAFLNAAVVAGARYKEVPLVFRDRAVGYSKNKVFNYTYDFVAYALEARARKWGLNIPIYSFLRKLRSFFSK